MPGPAAEHVGAAAAGDDVLPGAAVDHVVRRAADSTSSPGPPWMCAGRSARMRTSLPSRPDADVDLRDAEVRAGRPGSRRRSRLQPAPAVMRLAFSSSTSMPFDVVDRDVARLAVVAGEAQHRAVELHEAAGRRGAAASSSAATRAAGSGRAHGHGS